MTPDQDQRSHDLLRLLDELRELYIEWSTTIRRRLDAIRRAEVEVIQSCTVREEFLAKRVVERDGLRRQIVRRLAADVGVNVQAMRDPTISMVAERFDEPRRGQLLTSAAALREQVEAAHTLHRTAALVTGEMLNHLQEVGRAVTQSGSDAGVYSAEGLREAGAPVRVFEAVG